MNDKGSALIVITILTVLMMGILSQVAIIAPTMIDKVAIDLHSDKSYRNLKNELLQNPSVPTNLAITCETKENKTGILNQKASLCSFERGDYFLNMDELEPVACSQQIPLSQNTTLAGHALSPQSLKAESICTELDSARNDNRLYRGNLDYPGLVGMSGAIHFLGYVSLMGTINIQNDAQLFAGGDIIINQIVSNAPLPPRLFLHSRTGEISVKGFQGVNLICIAKVHNCGNSAPNLHWAPTSKTTQRLLYFE